MIQQISHALKPIFRTQTYRDLFYVIVWSGIWCAGGLVILAGFDYSMSSDYFVTAMLLCVWLLLTYTLILILTSVERLLEYVGGQNHDKSEIPNEQTSSWTLYLRSSTAFTLVFGFIKSGLGMAGIFLMSYIATAIFALLRLPLTFATQPSPQFGLAILEGSPLEWPSTIEFTYNIWEISFPYSTLFEPIYVTTRIEAFLGAGAGVLLLGISVYLISHYSKLLQQFNMFTFRNGASISVSHKRRTD